MTIHEKLTAMTDDELADLGTEFIDHGIPVFVVRLVELPTKTEKLPTTDNGHKDATLDLFTLAEQIEEARRRHPGAALGLGGVPGEGGYIALDYDVKNGAVGGRMLEQHRARYGEEIEQVSYYSISGAVNVLMRKPNADIKIANTSPWTDVDVRADNGWIVLPGVRVPWGSWGWRSGDLDDLDDAVMPLDMARLLVAAGSTESQPVTAPEMERWLDGGSTNDDEFTQFAVQQWVDTIALAGNRNPALFEAMSWLRRLDPSTTNRRRAYEAISAAWRDRMVRDGERGRMNEPQAVLQRVIGFALTQELVEEAEVEGERIESSFWSVDLSEWISGEVLEIVPELFMVEGSDHGLLYLDRYNEMHGDSGTGKSWAEAFCVRELVTQGRPVMVVDVEDNPAPLIQRLRQIGVPDRLISELVTFVHPTDEFGPVGVGVLIEQIVEQGIVHVFIDSLGEAFALSGVSENNDDEVGPWIRDVCRRIINETGAGVTVIDHITKAADNTLHPSGSKRKRAAITGSSWYLFALAPFDKEEGGQVRFRCGKDRHGTYKTGLDVADLVMEFVGPMCSLELHPVVEQVTERDERLDNLSRVAVVAAERLGGAVPGRALMHEMREIGGRGRNEAMKDGIEHAVARGFLSKRPDGRAYLYEYVSDWAELTASEWIARQEMAGIIEDGL